MELAQDITTTISKSNSIDINTVSTKGSHSQVNEQSSNQNTFDGINFSQLSRYNNNIGSSPDTSESSNNSNYQTLDTLFNVTPVSSISSPMAYNDQPLKTETTLRSLEHQQEESFRSPALAHIQQNTNQDINNNLKMSQIGSARNQQESSKAYFQPLPTFSESLSNSSFNYPRSSSLSYQSNNLNDSQSHYSSNNYQQHQLSQPRSANHSQSSIELNQTQFQFPLNSTLTTAVSSNANNDTYFSHGSSNQPQNSSIYPSNSMQNSVGNTYPSNSNTQQLPQLNFPITNSSVSPTGSYFPQQQFQQQFQQQMQLQQLPHPNEIGFQPRSQSYNEGYSSANMRRYNWSLETPHLVEHKQEEFNEEDVRVLKSLLFNGEKVKWRYVSSKLSVITGRRATSSACAKKTRELFKTPSEKNSGSLGSSLPYVVHKSWESIIEEES